MMSSKPYFSSNGKTEKGEKRSCPMFFQTKKRQDPMLTSGVRGIRHAENWG
jgi:hypothetical protein